MSKMLSSWKEIAGFFGKGVRTVQRWEKTLDLPIHRPPGAPSNVVLARTSDLEDWMHRGPVKQEMVAEELVADHAGLEREVRALARLTGVSMDAQDVAEGNRLDLFAEVIAKANAQLSKGMGISRAA